MQIVCILRRRQGTPASWQRILRNVERRVLIIDAAKVFTEVTDNIHRKLDTSELTPRREITSRYHDLFSRLIDLHDVAGIPPRKRDRSIRIPPNGSEPVSI